MFLHHLQCTQFICSVNICWKALRCRQDSNKQITPCNSISVTAIRHSYSLNPFSLGSFLWILLSSSSFFCSLCWSVDQNHHASLCFLLALVKNSCSKTILLFCSQLRLFQHQSSALQSHPLKNTTLLQQYFIVSIFTSTDIWRQTTICTDLDCTIEPELPWSNHSVHGLADIASHTKRTVTEQTGFRGKKPRKPQWREVTHNTYHLMALLARVK